MFEMVARSATESEATPGPKNSTNFSTTLKKKVNEKNYFILSIYLCVSLPFLSQSSGDRQNQISGISKRTECSN